MRRQLRICPGTATCDALSNRRLGRSLDVTNDAAARATSPRYRRVVATSTYPRLTRLAHRPAALATGDVAGLDVLCGRVDEWLGGDDLETSPLLLAIGRLNRSMDGPSTSVADIVTDLSIGLEAALSGTDRSDVSLRLRSRAADLLATDDDPADLIYEDVKALYGLRSGIIHGSVLTPSALGKSIRRVSTASSVSLPGVQVALALDRGRDLLRRAILARAALAAEESLWPLDDDVDVDRVLRTEPQRAAWRAHIRDYWDSVGLAAAVAPAPPLQLAFPHAKDRSADEDRSP